MRYFGYGAFDARVGGYGLPWWSDQRYEVLPEQIYTDAEVRVALVRADRRVRYLCYLLSPDLIRLRPLPVYDIQLDMDASAAVPGSMTGKITARDADGLDWAAARLMPAMRIAMPDGGEAERPLGVYIPIARALSQTGARGEWSIDAYDMTMAVRDDRLIEPLTIEAGTGYIDALTEIVMQAGIQHIMAQHTTAVLPEPMQYTAGTSRLDIANGLLTAIAYLPLHADAGGYLHMDAARMPYEMPVSHQYGGDGGAMICPAATLVYDGGNAPNVIIASASRLDAEPLTARWENLDSGSELSYVRRRRRVVRVDILDDVYSQDEIDAYARTEGYKVMAQYGRLEFSAPVMPGHGYRDLLYISLGDPGIDGRYQSAAWTLELRAGALMHHVAERVVMM